MSMNCLCCTVLSQSAAGCKVGGWYAQNDLSWMPHWAEVNYALKEWDKNNLAMWKKKQGFDA